MTFPNALLPAALALAFAANALAPLRAADAPPTSSAEDRAEAVRTALMYWKAVAVAETGLSSSNKRPLFDKWSKAVWERNYEKIDEKALAEEICLYDYSLDLLQTASQRPACDWGEVDSSNATWINPLLRCLRLRAWLRLRQGDVKRATDDLLTLMRATQHVGDQSLMLYDFSAPMQWLADYTAAAQLTKLDEASLQRLAAGIRALAPVPAPAAILRSAASDGLDRGRQQIEEAKAKRQTLQETDWFQTRLAALSEEPNAKPDEVAKIKEKLQHMTLDEYAQGLPAAYRHYEEEAKLMEQLPYAQSHQALEEYTAAISRRKESDPLPWLLTTLPNYVQDRTLRVTAHRAMLLAAIEAQLHGRAALAQAIDPASGAPFAVREVKGGYELESKVFGDNGKPVTMFVDSAVAVSAAAPSVADNASEDDFDLGPLYRRALGLGGANPPSIPANGPAGAPPSSAAAVATALTYWKSFSSMQNVGEEQRDLLLKASRAASVNSKRAGSPPPDEAALAKLLEEFSPSMDLFREASLQPACDWRLDVSKGLDVGLQHANGMQTEAVTFRMRAWLRLQQHQPAAAAEDLLTILHASQHLREPPFLIHCLVQVTLSEMATNLAAMELDKFDDASLQKLAADLKTLPINSPLDRVIEFEKDAGPGWLRRQVEQFIAKDEPLTQAKWSQDYFEQLARSISADKSGPAMTALRQMSATDFARQVDEAARRYDELAQLAKLPYRQSLAATKEFSAALEKRKESEPLAWQILINWAYGIQVRIARAQAMRDMLLTAIDARLHGHEALAKTPDPFGDGPFSVKEVGGGYELSSKLPLTILPDSKPVTLFVGSPLAANSAAQPTAAVTDNVTEDDIFDLGPFYRRALGLGGANQPGGSAIETPSSTAAAGDARNTALLYWQAFALAPQLTAEEKNFCWETFRSFNKATDKPVDEAALTKLLEKYEASLQVFQKAAALPDCDWQIDLSQGPYTLFSHLGRMQDMALALRLRARLRLRQHQSAAAEEDLKTILRAAAHLKNPAVLISGLVQTNLYGVAINGAAGGLAEFDEASRQKLVSDVQAYPPNVPLGAAMLTEKKAFVDWLRQRIDDSLAKHETTAQARWFQEWVNNILPMTGMGGGDLEKVGGVLRQMSMEELKRQVDEVDRLYRELAQLLEQPYAKSHPTVAEYVAKIKERKGAIPLAWLLVPDVGMCQNKLAQGQVWREMWLASVEARWHRREALDKTPDPFGDGLPFVVQEVSGGYKLVSKLVVDGKAVSLFVGN